MPSEEKNKKVPKIINQRFEISKKLGAGCFGEVFKGKDKLNEEPVAVKCEAQDCNAPQLQQEAEMLKILRKDEPVQGFVECLWYGKDSGYNCLVMELLGKSIEDMVQQCPARAAKGDTRKFNQKTTALVARQVLHRIEYLHSKGYVHRDIKPENFMFGVDKKIHHIYLIDFGLSKSYYVMDLGHGKHIAMRQKLSLTGTARYASINAHRGFEQSRRDDLEAIGHMLMYFLRGSVPWSGLEAKTKTEKYRRIMETKENTPLATLCEGYHDSFKDFLAYARELEFMARPDYNKLQDWFDKVCAEQGVQEGQDWAYEWMDKAPQGLVPVAPRGKIKQPDDQSEEKVAKKKSGGILPCLCGGKSKVAD